MDGTFQDATPNAFDCQAWGVLAENMADGCGKGDRVAMIEQIITDRWVDDTGTDVAVVTQADPCASKTDITNIFTGYGELAREVVTIPHDPAIVDGILQWGSLRPTTQRAWLRAAAVARGL